MFASLARLKRRRLRRIAAIVSALALAPILAAESAPASRAVPDFMAPGFGWDMVNSNATNFVDPPSGPKPVTFDPRYPHVGNLQPGQKTDRVADLTSPILKEWVKEPMRKANEAVLRGRTPFVATSLCWPGGVPAQLLVPTIVYVIQKPDVVYLIWERDHLVRRIHLNQKHTANPTPSFFGESVGHYENGDTLVIDTIGFVDHPLSFVDNYRTPHSKNLRVTERWKITGGGEGIEVSFTVYDKVAFNMPWSGLMRFKKEKGAMEEFVCAENNEDHFHLNDYSMPIASKPDF
jgi:hypothetical protein